MQLTFEPARLTGFTILALAAATALSVGACSSSKNQNPSASSTSQSAKPQGQAVQQVHGLIASVAGNAIQVTEKKDATAAVDFSPTTKVNEVTPAQFSNIANGNCVTVHPTAPASGAPVTAKIVSIVPAANGKCPQPKAPANSAPNQPLHGTVASVAGDTITVSTTDASGNPSQTAVKVNDKTQYDQVNHADSGAIAQGKCITASGKTKDANGALQATEITLKAANNGKC
jgi:uncharacterized protein DUF5666